MQLLVEVSGCPTTCAHLRELDRLLSMLAELGVETLACAPAAYTPTSRGRRYEQLRPTLVDLEPLAERVLEASAIGREIWIDLPSYTEAAWAQRALEEPWPADDEHHHRLVCRRNLDLFTGTSGVYLRRHGNLRADGAERVLERAFAEGPRSEESLYFPGTRVATGQLAGEHADPDGSKLYFEATSIRYRWLDRAAAR